MRSNLSRLRPAALLAFGLLVPARAIRPQAPATPAPALDTVRIGYILPDSSDARQRAFDLGVRFGIAEAAHAATLLRRALLVTEYSPRAIAPSAGRQDPGTVTAQQAIHTLDVNLLIVPALTDSLAAGLGGWAARPGRAVITAHASTPAVCSLPVFRTGPDSAARAAIVAAAPVSTAAVPGGSNAQTRWPTTVELWHPDLVRFGARQLSDRYWQRYRAPMTSDAWEGWIAVKVAWEGALRARDGDVASALMRGAFDGHKGTALRFGAPDRVLRQPLIIVPRPAHREASPTASASTGPEPLREIPWPAGDPGEATPPDVGRPCTP